MCLPSFVHTHHQALPITLSSNEKLKQAYTFSQGTTRFDDLGINITWT